MQLLIQKHDYAKQKRLIQGLLLLIAVSIGLFTLSGCGENLLGQNDSTFKKALESEDFISEGIAANDYLNDSAYELTECKVSNIEKDGEDSVRADISATIENANYTTEINLKAFYYDIEALKKNGITPPDDEYNFEILSDNTIPKKGIDFDHVRGFENQDSVLSDDTQSCTVTVDNESSFWFADTTTQTIYTYKFTGEKWTYGSEDIKRNVTYKNIEGNYAGKEGQFLKFNSISIGDLNTEKGSFVINYSVTPSESSLGEFVETNGVLNATISPKQGEINYSQADGYSYYFEATGTSSGGNSQAKITGYFSTNTAGESIIEITDGKIGVTAVWPKLSSKATNEVMNLGEGAIYKQ